MAAAAGSAHRQQPRLLLADVKGAADLLSLAPDALPPEAEIEALLAALAVSAPDPRTVVVRLARPAAYFVTAVANPVLAPMGGGLDRDARCDRGLRLLVVGTIHPHRVDS